MSEAYFLFNAPKPTSTLGVWTKLTGPYDQIYGYTYFGDFFLLNSTTNQCAILYTMPPELAELQYYGMDVFKKEFLPHEVVKKDLLKSEKAEKIEQRLGKLSDGEVFIPQPYPFLGGDSSIERYDKGNVWVFAEIIGQMQLG